MKTSIAILAFGASVAMAQDLGSLPACGQTCISNMLGLAPGFGCTAGDVQCYCSEPRFGYGVRDCANEACSKPADAAAVISFGTQYCAQALASISSSVDASALSILSSAATAASAAASSASAAASSGAGGLTSTPVTTSPLLATVTASDTSYVTTTGFTTLYAPAGDVSGAAASASDALASASSAVSGAAASASSALSGVLASGSSALSSAASKASSLASAASSKATSKASSAASKASSAGAAASSAVGTATSTGGASMITAAPVLAAGLAALLFV